MFCSALPIKGMENRMQYVVVISYFNPSCRSLQIHSRWWLRLYYCDIIWPCDYMRGIKHQVAVPHKLTPGGCTNWITTLPLFFEKWNFFKYFIYFKTFFLTYWQNIHTPYVQYLTICMQPRPKANISTSTAVVQMKFCLIIFSFYIIFFFFVFSFLH